MNDFIYIGTTALCVLTALAILSERYQMEQLFKKFHNVMDEDEKWILRMILREKRNSLNDTVDFAVLFSLLALIWLVR